MQYENRTVQVLSKLLKRGWIESLTRHIGAVLLQKLGDTSIGIQQAGDGGIVVQGVDDVGHVLSHVAPQVAPRHL